MSVHLRKDLDKLKKQLLSQCVLVEGRIETAVRAFLQRDLELAQRTRKKATPKWTAARWNWKRNA